MRGLEARGIAMTHHYTYRPNPYQDGAFQIFQKDHSGRAGTPVGDYILLDQMEERDFTEKKVMNLVSLLNGQDIIDLSGQTDLRLYFQKLDKGADGRCRVIFRTYKGGAISEENAIFTYEEGIFV
jgi:hypothetical protein